MKNKSKSFKTYLQFARNLIPFIIGISLFKKKIALDVRIDKHYSGKSDYALFEVWLENNGTINANLYFDEATFTVIRSDENTTDGTIKGETTTTTGLYSTKKRYRGRLRPSCSIRMPYYIKLSKDSKGKLHLIEFEIPADFGIKHIIHVDRLIIML